MKTLVVSYSLTGNNETLARRIAASLRIEHVRITESAERTNGTIFKDLILSRTPKVDFPLAENEEPDTVIFVGPVWVGSVATPFRASFKRLRKSVKTYAFVSISGGADGPNPKLAGDLKKRMRKEPAAVIDLHIADLLPSDPAPTRESTGLYRLDEETAGKLAENAAAILRQRLGDETPDTRVPGAESSTAGHSEGAHHVIR